VFEAKQGGFSLLVALLAELHNVRSTQRRAGSAQVIVFETTAGNPRLHAALHATITVRTREFLRTHQGERGVSPLAADTVWPSVHLAVDGDAAATACTEDHTEDNSITRGCAVDRLGDSPAIGIGRSAYLATHGVLEISFKRTPDEPGRIRILYQASGAHHRSRNADAH